MKSKLSIVFLIAAIVLIATSLIMLFGKQNGNEKGKEKEDGSITYNAIFKLDDSNSITSYKRNEKDIVVKLDTEATNATFNVTLEDNKASIFVGESTIELEYTTEGIIVSKNAVFKSGLYKKSKEYTKEDFYSENIGNIDYVKSNLNYVYKNGDNTIYLYEKEENTVRLMCTFKDNYYDLVLTKEGENYYSAEMFDEQYRIDIIDTGIKLTLGDENSTEFNGEYIKDKKLEIDEIISVFFAE